MTRLTSEIRVGEYLFRGVVSCEIDSSWDTLTDTAMIELPRRVSWKGRAVVLDRDPLLRKGDKVSIKLGYDDKNIEVFNGYVTKIGTNNPFTIECEDAMWTLKTKTITRSYRSVNLKKLLTDIVDKEIPFVSHSVDLGPFRISNATIVQVLDYIKKNYFQKSFIRNNKLYVGLAYWPELQSVHRLDFMTHVVSNDLEWVKKEDVKIRLRVVVISNNNKKVEYEYGEKEGEERTLHFYNISKSTADNTAGRELERLKYDGYRGTITIFGAPAIQHGDVVELTDKEYPERGGRYLVKSVNTTFGLSGFRQTLELDAKI